MRGSIILLLAALTPAVAAAQGIPEPEWQACFGGSGFDSGYSIQQTTDGGYIFVGETRSNNGQVTGFHGDIDWWVVRTNATGELIWQRALGGSGAEIPRAVVQTLDGGFVVAGSSGSIDGDLAGVASTGRAWVVKLDAGGAIQWQQRYGDTFGDTFWAMEQTATGELLLAGIRNSTTEIPGCNQGGSNAWLVKLDSAGELLWERCYGGSYDEIFVALDITDDGGCIAAGQSTSSDGDVAANYGQNDQWVVKVNAIGDIEWEKNLGGSSTELAFAIKQTDDGGYMVGGTTRSSNGDVTGHQGQADVWVLKLDPLGALLWQHALGGSGNDSGRDVLPHPDGGLTVAGWTESSDGDVSQLLGAGAGWLIRLDGNGELLWEKTFGGSVSDVFESIIRTSDQGFALIGGGRSSDGDGCAQYGEGDLWLVKLGAEPVGVPEMMFDRSLSLFPNPSQGSITLQLTIDETTPVDLTWYDASGRALHATSTSLYAPGRQEIFVDMEGLPNGVLFLQVQIGEQRLMRQVVKL